MIDRKTIDKQLIKPHWAMLHLRVAPFGMLLMCKACRSVQDCSALDALLIKLLSLLKHIIRNITISECYLNVLKWYRQTHSLTYVQTDPLDQPDHGVPCSQLFPAFTFCTNLAGTHVKNCFHNMLLASGCCGLSVWLYMGKTKSHPGVIKVKHVHRAISDLKVLFCGFSSRLSFS